MPDPTAAYQVALRETLAVIEELHALDDRPIYCETCGSEPCEYREAWQRWTALLNAVAARPNPLPEVEALG